MNSLKHFSGYTDVNKGYQLNTVRISNNANQMELKKEELRERLKNKKQNKK